jgi:nitroreductase
MSKSLEFFERRRSIRKFKAKPVSDEDIRKVLYAASLAPTARNVQPWEFIVVKDEALRRDMARLAWKNGPFIAEAPVCVVVVSQKTKYYLEDASAATTQALLCAAALGLGACWVAGDKKDYRARIEKLLGVPSDYRLVSLIALGVADESPSPQKRDIGELIHSERF